MKERRGFLNLRCGNRGIIFTIDVMIALIITLTILAAANFYVNRIGVDNFSDLQIRRTGSDIVVLLDNLDQLDPPNVVGIWGNVSEILPSYYDINLTGSGGGGCDFGVGSNVPNDKSILTGRRFFMINNTDEYCLILYRIWQK